MDKLGLKNKYKAARATIMAVIAFEIIDSVMLSISANATVLYTIIIPQLAIAYSKYYFSGMQAVLLRILFVIFPIILNIICYILSKKERKWMVFATVMAFVDAIALVLFIAAFGFNSTMMIDIAVEILILVYLVRGCQASKKLDGDFEITEETADNINITADDPTTNVRLYSYNKEMAKKNGTNRMGTLILSFIGFITIFIIMIFVIAYISTYNEINPILNMALVLIVLVTDFVGYFIVVAKLTPYTSAKNIQYFQKDGKLCRVISSKTETIQSFADLRVVEKTKSEFKCEYTADNGKRKKLMIPNCYPNIEEIL